MCQEIISKHGEKVNQNFESSTFLQNDYWFGLYWSELPVT